MLSKEQFITLDRDFVESQDFVELVGDVDVSCGRDFVCHHNAYLVAGFLNWRGQACRWMTGRYRCKPPAPDVHHSWVEITVGGGPAVIFEFDPRQLFERGGYADDLMPSGHIPKLGMRITPVAIIVSPYVVELPDDRYGLPFVVSSQDVLDRYVPDR